MMRSARSSALCERVQDQFRICRRLVREVEPGEVLQFAAPRLLIQALRIALFADFERRIDEYLDEFARRDEFARHLALGPERRDEGDIVIKPASTKSFATSATRRIFSTRSASVKPRSRLSPCRTLSPSSTNVRLPSA